MSSSVQRKMRRASAQAEAKGADEAPDIIAKAGRLVDKALDVLEKILDDAQATAATKLRAVAMVFERVYGRPRQAAKPAGKVPTVNLVSTVPDLTVDEWLAKHGARPDKPLPGLG